MKKAFECFSKAFIRIWEKISGGDSDLRGGLFYTPRFSLCNSS